eukprot:4382785-Pleurochrysis_carterae.AAC.1
MNLSVWNSASSRDVQDQGPIIIKSPADAFGDRFGKSARARQEERRFEGQRRQGGGVPATALLSVSGVLPYVIGGAADSEAKSGSIISDIVENEMNY